MNKDEMRVYKVTCYQFEHHNLFELMGRMTEWLKNQNQHNVYDIQVVTPEQGESFLGLIYMDQMSDSFNFAGE